MSNVARMRNFAFILTVCLIALEGSSSARGGIRDDQILVVYNSITNGGTAMKDYYLAAHPGIPAANVFDIQNAQVNDIELDYARFVTMVRNPIRNYLLLPGAPSPSDILAICIIRPFPHRIMDTNTGDSGDGPGSMYDETNAGDATGAALDSELALLWQDLDVGEAGGMMDSKSDNFIVNPYHKHNDGIDGYSRANITIPKVFTNTANICWLLGGTGATQLTPGDIYLVCRIDGNTAADARAEIDRARNLYVNKAIVKVLLDEYNVAAGGNFDNDGLFTNDANDPFWGGNDYELTRDLLLADGWNVRYDAAFNFIDCTEETAPLIGYASYGENDSVGGFGEDPPGNGTYIECFNFAPGAMFNTIESYNGRAFNGIGALLGQEQVSDFIAFGGTFGIGNVYEPFSFSVGDNAFLMPNMLVHGLTYAEAAYASLPALSWQQLAVGDPLAKMTVINDPGLPKGDMNGDGLVNGLDIKWFVNVLLNGPAQYRTTFPALDPVARGDFTGEYKLNFLDVPGFVNALLTAP